MAGHRYKERDALRDPETGEWDVKEVRHRAKGWIAVLLAFGVFAVGGVLVATTLGGWWQEYRTAGDYAGPGTAEVVVTVPSGANAARIGQILEDARVVKDAKSFQRAAQMRPDDAKKLQAGKYKLMTEIASTTALDMLLDPARAVRSFMQLREGQRMSQQLDSMAKATGIPVAQFTEAVEDGTQEALGLPEWAAPRDDKTKAEGFLFPDTYEVPAKPTALSAIRTATGQFDKVATRLDFVTKARSTPVKDPYKVLIVASIIEREVHRTEDRPKVARVLYNRLDKGMKLQMDSTVTYAVGKTDTVWTTEAERASRSPYNTYRHRGLPPGPISAPAEEALAAAANPAPGDWLYFVTVNLDTGETAFTADAQEHFRNADRLQQWCKATPENRKKCA